MKIQITITGEHRDQPDEWPQGWPVPREGEEVTLGNGANVYVRHVVWHPSGSTFNGGDSEPFVYVVLGPRRPE